MSFMQTDRFAKISPIVFCGGLMMAWTLSGGDTCRGQDSAKLLDSEASSTSLDASTFQELMEQASGLVAAFNHSDVAAIEATFLPDGELVDEQGNLHQGTEEIRALAKSYFERFPGSTTEMEIQSVRRTGPVYVLEGIRVNKTKDGSNRASIRFLSIWTKVEDRFKIASLRDFPEPTVPSPNEMLQSLAWLIGDWINEGADGRVKMNYEWSTDKNFILGEYVVFRDGKEASKSSIRIAWDASQNRFRSWTFDSDGSFGESHWIEGDGMWIIQSEAVATDGTRGSARIELVPEGKDRFIFRGMDRTVDGVSEPEYEISVVRTVSPVSK